ncbi:MAG: hypothetical protein ACFFD4_08105 [Candidatus Odinarchaeota archaeon]
MYGIDDNEEESDLITLEDLEFSTCGECGHWDEFNQSCWVVFGRFGEFVFSDRTICQGMYNRLVLEGRYDK